jgi:anti-anti-sigma regulatory factor
MSTACVQVFTAAVLEILKSGAALVLKKSSPAFGAAFVNLGLGGILDAIKSQDTK